MKARKVFVYLGSNTYCTPNKPHPKALHHETLEPLIHLCYRLSWGLLECCQAASTAVADKVRQMQPTEVT